MLSDFVVISRYHFSADTFMLVASYLQIIISWFKEIISNQKSWEKARFTVQFLRVLIFCASWAASWQNHVRPAKTQISLGIHPVWSESSLSAWRELRSLATHWAHSKDSDQTGWMRRLIWVFAGRTVVLLVLSWGWSYSFSWQLRTYRVWGLYSVLLIVMVESLAHRGI